MTYLSSSFFFHFLPSSFFFHFLPSSSSSICFVLAQYVGSNEWNDDTSCPGICPAGKSSALGATECHECTAGKYGNDVVECSTLSSTNPLTSKCKCSKDAKINECLAKMYCWPDNTCRDSGIIDCTLSSTNPLTSKCKCAKDAEINECLANKFCYPDSTCKDIGVLDCSPSNSNVRFIIYINTF